MVRYVASWFALAVLAIVNGTLREVLFKRSMAMPELAAGQLSCATGILFLGIGMWGILRFWPPESDRHAALIGGIWLMMTVAFEFLFGHFVAGHAWTWLLADYDVAAGRLWPFVLLWIAVAPLIIVRIQRTSSSRAGMP